MVSAPIERWKSRYITRLADFQSHHGPTDSAEEAQKLTVTFANSRRLMLEKVPSRVWIPTHPGRCVLSDVRRWIYARFFLKQPRASLRIDDEERCGSVALPLPVAAR